MGSPGFFAFQGLDDSFVGMKPYKGTVETLGDLRDHGMGLYASCTAPNVGHGAQLDLGMLIERFGEDYVFINETRIGRSLRCKQCGHRGAEVRLVSNTTRTDYAKAKGV